MKILGINAGPRKKGNTARIIEEVAAGARDAGHETIIFHLGDMKINPLMDAETGYGYPDDDFNEIMPHIESMGALVFGSPIYYDQVSSRAKTFIDRLYYYSKSHGQEYRDRFPDGVKFIYATTCGWDDPEAYDEVIDWVNGRMTNYWNMIIHGSLKGHGTGKNPVRDNEKLLKKARELGKSL